MRSNSRNLMILSGPVGIVVGGALMSVTGAGEALIDIVARFIDTRGDVRFDAPGFWMFFASLFAIMNPLVAVPFFVSMTNGHSEKRRGRLALIATLAVCLALVAAALFGREILGFFAISVSSFRIAGGIIVLLMGLSLLQAKAPEISVEASEASRAASRDSEAICPLAIPLLAGPGAIATIIIRCETAERTCDFITIAAVIAAMVVVTYVVLRLAVPVARFLGQSGLTVMTRLIGMIVAAIAIDMMVIGLRNTFPGMVG
jgi:multiple antibiotic resistance protein